MNPKQYDGKILETIEQNQGITIPDLSKIYDNSTIEFQFASLLKSNLIENNNGKLFVKTDLRTDRTKYNSKIILGYVQYTLESLNAQRNIEIEIENYGMGYSLFEVINNEKRYFYHAENLNAVHDYLTLIFSFAQNREIWNKNSK
jgi:hypothetical protein